MSLPVGEEPAHALPDVVGDDRVHRPVEELEVARIDVEIANVQVLCLDNVDRNQRPRRRSARSEGPVELELSGRQPGGKRTVKISGHVLRGADVHGEMRPGGENVEGTVAKYEPNGVHTS